MKEKRDCKIVQDLLPNYIDKLTTQDTNDFIENHLKECQECTKILENMKKDFDIEDTEKQKKVKNVMKKYKNKLKFFKFTILIIIVIFLLMLDRRAMIMIGLNAKANAVKNKTAYNMRVSFYNENEVYRIQVYRRDNEYTRELSYSSLAYEENIKIQEYPHGDTSNYYIDDGNTKQALLNKEPGGVYQIKLEDYYFRANSDFIGFIRNVLFTSIKKEKLHSSVYDYYCISNIRFENVGLCDIYVEKDTGFISRIIAKTDFYSDKHVLGGNIIDISHGSFNLFEEPDVSEYEIIEEQTPENTKVRR